MLVTVMCERPCDPIEKTLKDNDCVLPDGVDVGTDVDAMVRALPKPPEGDNVSSDQGAAIAEESGAAKHGGGGEHQDSSQCGGEGRTPFRGCANGPRSWRQGH